MSTKKYKQKIKATYFIKKKILKINSAETKMHLALLSPYLIIFHRTAHSGSCIAKLFVQGIIPLILLLVMHELAHFTAH